MLFITYLIPHTVVEICQDKFNVYLENIYRMYPESSNLNYVLNVICGLSVSLAFILCEKYIIYKHEDWITKIFKLLSVKIIK
jgi:hypothetical protein